MPKMMMFNPKERRKAGTFNEPMSPEMYKAKDEKGLPSGGNTKGPHIESVPTSDGGTHVDTGFWNKAKDDSLIKNCGKDGMKGY